MQHAAFFFSPPLLTSKIKSSPCLRDTVAALGGFSLAVFFRRGWGGVGGGQHF